MTDLCIPEFEDTIWDGYFCADDHEVPQHGFERCNDHFLWGKSCNKSHCEVISISRNTEHGSVYGYTDDGREQNGYSVMVNQQSTALEKGSESHKQSGIFSSSNNEFIEEKSGVACDSTGSSSHRFESNETCSKCEFSVFSVNDTCLSVPVDDISRNCSLEDATSMENTLNFIENVDSVDLFGWPVIGDFEDVDLMFRICDSTFGIGVSKEDKLDCLSPKDESSLSPKDDKGIYRDPMELDFKFPCPESKASEHTQENSDSSTSYLAKDSSKFSSSMSKKSDLSTCFATGSDMANDKDRFLTRNKINERETRSKELNQSDDISLKAASFSQLQLVMEWLDLKTKLCIRDGLYRLAQGAENRRNHANLNGFCGDEKFYSGSYLAEGTNKCTNFMNMETNTNPIDRSIAHLLFHRPSDSSPVLAHDSLLYKQT